MSIRKLTEEDYDAYLPLINQFRPTTFTKEDFSRVLNKIHNSSDIWVIQESDILVATATIMYEHKFLWNTCIYAHIEDVCVHKDYRRGGYGKKLVHHLLGEAKRHSCYKITLDCASDNVPFYTACGLSPRGIQMCELASNLDL
jgi:ribosomal protein S18 acetylase RimI-like enzyme